MVAERAFLMVWDGLRPDFVSAERTPNLWRLAQQGVWFERSHAVYPTLTRANSPAISTGCRPGRAGVPGNSFCLPSGETFVEYTTGDAANLQRLADADGRPILLVDTLADRVHRTGGTTVVVGSGSPGSALLQHPRYAECGDFVISPATLKTGQVREAMLARFGTPPPRRVPATDWDRYFTRIITDFVVPEVMPTLLVFWHTDPDHTSHARGHRAAETLRSLKDADDNLGAILETYARLGMRDSTAVVITSDHGTSTITRRVQPAHDLATVTSGGAVAENGGSVFVYTTDPAAAVGAIRKLDYAGPIFTRDGAEQTFSLALVGLDGPRAPDIVFSMEWSDTAVDGMPGVAVGTHAKLAVDHGTISPFELRNTLVCQGPDFRAGWRDSLPVGNIDIAPTLAQVLGLAPGTPFEGRVLEEALRDAVASHEPSWETRGEMLSFSARDAQWTQRVWFECVGSSAYLTGGAVEGGGLS
jgi:arylsulfatase A-like enzyme